MHILFYNFLIKLFYFPYCLIIFFRKFKSKEHPKKFKEKIKINKINRPKGYLFWFHAASIGELKTIFPVIDFFLQKDTEYNFLITTVTLSSYQQFEKKYGKNKRVFHQFLPYDANFLVENFLKNWKPNIVSFVDSEIWPNFFLKIKKENLPFILLNGRITKKTFKRWKLTRNFACELFQSFDLIIASNKQTVEHLNFFKAKNIKYFGNIKFCSKEENLDVNDINQINLHEKEKVWCAVSTHSDEEILCAKVHLILKKTFSSLKTIIIPRHINRTKDIYYSLKKMNLSVQIKNDNQNIDSSKEIILINYYGSVLKYFKKFKLIFMGKSFLKKMVNDGGQNPIDAAKMGCFIFHGPYVSNFQEIYEYLNSENIAEEVNSINKFAERLKINFEKGFNENNNIKNKLKSYGNEIHMSTISEYMRLIK